MGSAVSTDGRSALSGLGGEQVQRLLGAVLDVAGDLSLPHVLQRIVDSAVQLAGARYGALGMLDDAGTALTEFVFTGIDDEARRRIGTHPTGKGVLGLLIARPEPVRLRDIREHPLSYGFPPDHPQMHSFLGVPIRVGAEVFGNLYLAEKGGGADFTAGDERVVVALAAAAGVAIEKARLYGDSRRRERWSAAANAIVPALLTERGPDAVLQEVVAHAREAAGSDLAAVALPADGGMAVVAAAGARAAEVRGCPFPTTHPAVSEVLGGPGAVRRQDPSLLPALAPGTVDGCGMSSFLLAPLTLGSDPLGVLLVAGVRPFLEEDRRSVEVFARHAALALEVARGQDDQQRLALYEDRDRIARDLHDLVIQRLCAIGLDLHGLRGRVTQPEVADRLAGHVAELDQTIRDIRATIFALHDPPEPAAPRGLRAQLLRLVQDAARTLRAEPRITFIGPLDRLVPDRVRVDVLATLREALTNVARHAGAASVDVEVALDPATGRLELRVCDDGGGLRGAPPGRGVANMGDRARRWGGRCVVRTRSAGGTEVHWSVPVPAP